MARGMHLQEIIDRFEKKRKRIHAEYKNKPKESVKYGQMLYNLDQQMGKRCWHHLLACTLCKKEELAK
jgi:hypothetical protein